MFPEGLRIQPGRSHLPLAYQSGGLGLEFREVFLVGVQGPKKKKVPVGRTVSELATHALVVPWGPEGPIPATGVAGVDHEGSTIVKGPGESDISQIQ